MGNHLGQPASPFDTLDRAVVLATLGGLIFNGFDGSLSGMALTSVAAIIYGISRNRIANLESFALVDVTTAPPGVNLSHFTLICEWLGSRQLFDGLLGDLVDPDIGGSEQRARQYLRETLWRAIGVRLKEKVITLLWFDRSR